MILTEYEAKCSKKRKDVIDQVIDISSKSLFSRMRLPIYINIRPIRKLTEKKGIYGDCLDEGDREFTIRIDVSIPIEDMVATLFHELVHVHQYLSGRLKSTYSNEVIYEGTLYDWDMEYDSRPWEIEAHSKEQQLKGLWNEHRKYT